MPDIDRVDRDRRVVNRRPSAFGLAMLFARYANLTFGGGSATIAVLRRELERRGWMTSDQFAISFAFARLTPGTNLLAFCTGIGWLLRGLRGAIVALFASSLPSAAVVVIATAMFDRWRGLSWASAAIQGAVAAAVAITVATSWTVARPYLQGRGRAIGVLVVVAAFALNALLGLSPVFVLALAAVGGFVSPVERR